MKLLLLPQNLLIMNLSGQLGCLVLTSTYLCNTLLLWREFVYLTRQLLKLDFVIFELSFVLELALQLGRLL